MLGIVDEPVVGQELDQFIFAGPTNHAVEDVFQIGPGLDEAVLATGHQRRQDRGAVKIL